jgi:hypothetical protein
MGNRGLRQEPYMLDLQTIGCQPGDLLSYRADRAAP